MAQVAGLEFSTSAMLGQMASVPAPFLRPLEYVLELLEASPSLYRPITQADLAAGFPPPDWCLPLHMELTKCDALTANEAEQPPPTGAGAALPPRTEAEIAAALSGAPYWYVVTGDMPSLDLCVDTIASAVKFCFFYQKVDQLVPIRDLAPVTALVHLPINLTSQSHFPMCLLISPPKVPGPQILRGPGKV